MLIVMDRSATGEDVGRVVAAAERLGLKAHPIPGAQRTAVGITGNKGTVGPAAFESLPGVLEVIRVSHPYKLVSREFHPEDTIVSVGGVPVGGTRIVVIAGPCAVETRDQTLTIARQVKARGADLLRGGAYKPRTSPYAFQGLAEEGLKILAEARKETGLPVVTEVLDTETVDLVASYADCLQVGARNMQNFELLKKAGPHREARAPEARDVGHARGVSAGGRVRPLGGQPERRPVRARHPYVLGFHPQHARPLGRAGRRAPVTPADRRRPVARDRTPRQGPAHVTRVDRGRAPTASRSRSTTSRPRLSRTARRRSRPTCSAS